MYPTENATNPKKETDLQYVVLYFTSSSLSPLSHCHLLFQGSGFQGLRYNALAACRSRWSDIKVLFFFQSFDFCS